MGKISANLSNFWSAMTLSLLAVGFACKNNSIDSGSNNPTKKPIAQQSNASKMLRVAIEAEPAHLVSTFRPDAWAHRISNHHILEPLIQHRLDPPHKLKPALARTWTRLDNGSGYAFQLRKNVKWHDGQKFSANDVVFTFQLLMNKKVPADSARAAIAPFIEKVEKVNENLVHIYLKKQSPFFLNSLTNVVIFPKHILADQPITGNAYLSHPIGTGPYKFRNWKRGQHIDLVAFEEYWGKKANVKRVRFLIVRDANLALNLVRRKEVDFIFRLRDFQLKQVNKKGSVFQRNYRVQKHIAPGVTYIVLNHRKWPMNNKKFRKLLAFLLPKKMIATSLLRSTVQSIASLYSPNDSALNRDLKDYQFSPALAKNILSEMKASDSNNDGIYEVDKRPLKFEFLVAASSSTTRKWTTVYQQELKKAGISMEIKTLEWSTLLSQLQKGEFDATPLGIQFSGTYSDLFLQFHSSQVKGGLNYGGYIDPQLDSLLVRVREDMNEKTRTLAARQLQKKIHDDVVAIPLFAMTEFSLVSNQFANVVDSPLAFRFDQWKVK